MPSSKTRLLTAMVIALGVASAVGTGKAAAAEAAPLLGQIQPSLSETDPGIGDREHLRRYFLQEGFHGLRR